MTNDIAYICDDKYFLPTVVSILSIIDNSTLINEKLYVHVCSFGLTDDNISFFRNLSCDKVNVDVRILDINLYKVKISKISQKTHVTPTSLIKFEFPVIFENIENLLYLDSDIIVKDNLYELLNMNLFDYYMAASYDFWNHLNRIRYTLHRTVSSSFYFNSGVMLMNLDKMRNDSVSEQLWYFKIHKAKTKLMDQESLNAVCKSNVLPLSLKWNFNPAFLDIRYIKELNKVYSENFGTDKELERNIKIIHYVGKKDKPWIYKNARMRCYWDYSYDRISKEFPLLLKDAELSKTSLFGSIKRIINQFGVYGLFSYLVYTLRIKYEK